MSLSARPLCFTFAVFAMALAASADAQPRRTIPMRLVGVTASGPLRGSPVRNGLARATGAMRECPMDGVRDRSQLRVAMLLAATGVVSRVRVLASDGVPFATSSCVAERLQEAAFEVAAASEVTAVDARWIFAAPAVARTSPMLAPLVTDIRGGALPTQSAPSVPQPTPPRANPPLVTGQVAVSSVDADVTGVAPALHSQVARDEAALRGCYNVRLNTWGPAEGTLVFALTFTAGARRHPVERASQVGGTLTEAEPARCLIEWFRRQVYDLEPSTTRATIALRFTMDTPSVTGAPTVARRRNRM